MDNRFSFEQVILKGATEYNGDALPTSTTLSALTGYDTWDNFFLYRRPSMIEEGQTTVYQDDSISNDLKLYQQIVLRTPPYTYDGTFTGNFQDSTSTSLETIINKPYLWIIEAGSVNQVKVVAGQDESLGTAQNLPVVVDSTNKLEENGVYRIELVLKTRFKL